MLPVPPSRRQVRKPGAPAVSVPRHSVSELAWERGGRGSRAQQPQSPGQQLAAARAHRLQIMQAVERTMKRHHGRRYDVAAARSPLEATGPRRVSSAPHSTVGADGRRRPSGHVIETAGYKYFRRPSAPAHDATALVPRPPLASAAERPGRERRASFTFDTTRPNNVTALYRVGAGSTLEEASAVSHNAQDLPPAVSPNEQTQTFGLFSAGASTGPLAPHPWKTLIHLGSSTFNDTPLYTFMAALSLGCAVNLRYADWVPDDVGTPQPCVVHLDDVEATRFRVETPSSLFTSPILPMIAALGGPWSAKFDGALFHVTPLLDSRGTPSADQAPLAPSSLTRSASANLTHQPRAPVATQHGAQSVLTLEATGLSAETEEGEQVTTPDDGGVSIVDLDGTIAEMRAVKAAPEARERQSVEKWRRYCTAVALYLSLADAGVCDPLTLPFVSVQLMRFSELLGGCDVRIETITSCDMRRIGGLLARGRTTEVHPVAVTLPMARKGVLRAAPGPATSILPIATQPFTDAEVFQLFYLQLVLRAFFDMRFPHMTWRRPDSDKTGPGIGCLRSDRIGWTVCEENSLAFECPFNSGAWLAFPVRVRLLTILDLENAVLPAYATPRELQSSSGLPLFGSTPDVSCQSSFGYTVVQWAAQQKVDSPRAAYKALGDLFGLFAARYGCGRDTVWRSSVPLKSFRCSESAAFQTIPSSNAKLSRFLVPEEARHVQLDSPSRHSTATAAAEQSTPLLAAASVPISRKGSELSIGLPRLTLPIVEPLTLVMVPPSGTELSDATLAVPAAVMEHSATVGLGHSFSVLEPPIAVSLADTAPGTAPVPGALRTPGPSAVSSLLEQQLETRLAVSVGATSPFTHQVSLVSRWRHYAHAGDTSLFDGVTVGIELQGFLGRGGSGLVYRGKYGKHGLPVAVKVFIIPDLMEHEAYVRDSLTDVAFCVLNNQLDDFGICSTCRAHDFIVSAVPPLGLPEEDANTARRSRDSATTRLCYLVTDLMDGTLGRFVGEDEDDFDPCYDQLINSPLQDGELFQFLFAQLASKSMFDWKVLDLMLQNQLRGDNVGYRHVDLTGAARAALEADPDALTEALLARSYYRGIIVAFQKSPEEPMRYLRFRGDLGSPDTAKAGPLRFICFIDLGQGIQPNVAELTRKKFIGETIVDSCVHDDGFGRYWPLDEVYCRYVDVHGDLAKDVYAWGSQLRINSQDDAAQAMGELLELYYPTYGVPSPAREELLSHMLFTWSPSIVSELKKAYVYRPDTF